VVLTTILPAVAVLLLEKSLPHQHQGSAEPAATLMARACYKYGMSGAPTLAGSDGRRLRGERTHREILATAVDIGSREGLQALTIGGLAAHSGVSKSGLFAHFGSKQELQLATIDAARRIFREEVIEPALAAPEGLPRLEATLAAWLDYFRRDVFPGGCFFQAASLEFDGRPGPVRDSVLEVMSQWLDWLTGLADGAELPAGLEPAQLAFELNAIGMATNWQRQLLGDGEALERAERAFERALASAETR
jgi:AcrR family transcriptional regulator